jgi:predicted RNase H-like nuclease (RuvC/YqgF family)
MSTNNKLKSENPNSVNGSKPAKDSIIALQDTITSLKCELRLLYESMKDKNEFLCKLEKDVRDRDISIRYLKSEFTKLKDSIPTSTANKENGQKGESCKPQNNISNKLNGDEMITKLERAIKDRDHMIKELKQKVLRVSDNLSFVQRESLLKDAKIQELQHDNDKFRQVVSDERR